MPRKDANRKPSSPAVMMKREMMADMLLNGSSRESEDENYVDASHVH